MATGRGIGAIHTHTIVRGIGTDRGMAVVGTATTDPTTADMPIHAPMECAVSAAATSAASAPAATPLLQDAISAVQCATSVVGEVLYLIATSAAGATQTPIITYQSTVNRRRSVVHPHLVERVEAVRLAVRVAEAQAEGRMESRLAGGVDVCGTDKRHHQCKKTMNQ